MADLAPSLPADTARTGGLARLAVAATVALLFAGGGFLLHAEQQGQVIALLAAFVGVFALAEKVPVGRRIVGLCRAHPGTVNLTAALSTLAIAAALREEHYTLLMMATVALFATAAAGLTLQMAFAGVPNFAGAAFFAVGAYVAALLGHTGIPHLLVLLIAGLAAAVLGLVLLLPVLRTRGHYAALVTIAFGLLLRAFLEVNDVLGGPQGMKVKSFSLFGLDFSRVTEIGPYDVSFYLPYALASCALFALAFFLVRRLETSFVGVALDAVRSDEVAASVFGLSIARWKATAFLLGNAMIGVAGALYGMMNGFVNPNSANFGDSLIMLSILVLGGLGNLWGAVVAAVVILVIPEKLQAIQEFRLVIFALLVIAILRFRPSGLMPRAVRDFSALVKGGSR
ncbi:ABC-type branched-subunit amino acid transport system permease subunit [Xanthobacter sp. SG618]|uniref:branched-chain amino acid ABC transporter permease n=1 Tax=Xanthobacter sp. SG618 TaxID=2587121 RepID=UPI0017F02D21|nr:branched-chain amino acid ABC transporter permease [Xanthobacter sp. SG618]NMN58734.1 ABC-type branched-subunit amino acid transport system permease subunit [Xanthobacter sp. SG618]